MAKQGVERLTKHWHLKQEAGVWEPFPIQGNWPNKNRDGTVAVNKLFHANRSAQLLFIWCTVHLCTLHCFLHHSECIQRALMTEFVWTHIIPLNSYTFILRRWAITSSYPSDGWPQRVSSLASFLRDLTFGHLEWFCGKSIHWENDLTFHTPTMRYVSLFCFYLKEITIDQGLTMEHDWHLRTIHKWPSRDLYYKAGQYVT